ncbi:TPA_asm: hypothetical protein GIM83_01835 [Listeria monocytogenes]|uniref:hypothetical protein n=1 Tax=Listeria seeligeri TaxID=1640 RepID=UPI00175D5F63|nr:hypothetical protein [Listeria seeligeri]EAF0822595.1 hypothetical protein [Listeria monocytogenes]EHZ5950861.1 hypothetical protein [Listeria monocytogenes]EIE7838043.1 hypothetical protein [Listeria monocytogenes]EIE8653783.1 hypothetical protein [Listeria monocytogenes]EIJ7591308.1 hypothetical protein [Listeria monocytogenes]
MPFNQAGIDDNFIYDTLASGEIPVFRGWPTTEEIQNSKYHFISFSREGIEKGNSPASYIERIVVSYVSPSTSETAADLEDIIDVLVRMGLNFRDSTEDTLLYKDTKEEYTILQITVTRPRLYSKQESDINGKV